MKPSFALRLSLHAALGAVLGVAALGLGVGCIADPPEASSLELSRLDGATVAGRLTVAGSEVTFESSSLDQRQAVLLLDVNGAAMRFTYDVAGVLTEDGRHNALYAEDRRALLELRDALGRHHPEVVRGSLQGLFLARHADWLADAPDGYSVETRAVDVQDRIAARAREQAGAAGKGNGAIVANSTNNDSSSTATCLRPGLTYRAFYDAGNGGAQWQWDRVANSGSCLGRCGAGCNIFDTDLMLDCFEHDVCLDHFGGSVVGDNPNCGDEFNHAVAEYTVTFDAWCPF